MIHKGFELFGGQGFNLLDVEANAHQRKRTFDECKIACHSSWHVSSGGRWCNAFVYDISEENYGLCSLLGFGDALSVYDESNWSANEDKISFVLDPRNQKEY